MAVNPAKKTPQLLFFLAVVAYPGTSKAKVHNLVLTHEDTYEKLLEELDLKASAIDGGEMHIVVAATSASAYFAARNGGTGEQMLDKWLAQQGV